MDWEVLCSICDKPLKSDVDKITKVQMKGLKTFIKKSLQREDGKWHHWIGKSETVFHETCRKRYSALSCRQKTIIQTDELPLIMRAPPSLPSTLVKDDFEMPSSSTSHLSGFNFSNLCFICNKSLNRKYKEVRMLQHKYTRRRLIYVGTQKNDEKSAEVIRRLQSIDSLESIKAFYHRKCYLRFMSNPSPKPTTPILNEKTEVGFKKVCYYIEKSGNYQFSLPKLRKIMRQHDFNQKILFKKLKEKYGEEIFILQHRGRQPIIYYKTLNISKICSDWFCNDELTDFEKKTILTVAAKILCTEITKCNSQNDSYPPDSFLDNVTSNIPKMLTNFLRDLLLTGEENELQEDNAMNTQCDSIAHSIVYNLRTKNISNK